MIQAAGVGDAAQRHEDESLVAKVTTADDSQLNSGRDLEPGEKRYLWGHRCDGSDLTECWDGLHRAEAGAYGSGPI